MNFSDATVKRFEETLDKLERYFAYKYEHPKKDVFLMFNGRYIRVLINGKYKETFHTSVISTFKINEETGSLK